LIAYQVAFDIEDNATQEFCNRVKAALPAAPKVEEPVKDANEMQVDEQSSLLVSTGTYHRPSLKL
jgi:hypothetical protein